ncbi:hypothetical protein GUITHDRAFT_150027 [Guillardia theta CCMP2712]|uniref:Uncharacterized protein n=1 Tax=Guillardia theta (strain CCMP2712) TaxID=905079 RepID=L1K211_GUITC|nr:hypothetical protein GUITHDRAFT_150027 [Guillardia theta CCMP2712]EKX54490.1 hypothetical protein GUITHDRAFT_150027 [Guillardia theta CCMP2712]|eukprot:XP_005841470.1 hypothetical protein GUITHDRAFT_150027 [Guillardia theta CCMP2712]
MGHLWLIESKEFRSFCRTFADISETFCRTFADISETNFSASCGFWRMQGKIPALTVTPLVRSPAVTPLVRKDAATQTEGPSRPGRSLMPASTPES